MATDKPLIQRILAFHVLLLQEYMQSQGLVMAPAEEMPPDPYTQTRQLASEPAVTKTPSADDKLRRFLEYDGKVLKLVKQIFQYTWSVFLSNTTATINSSAHTRLLVNCDGLRCVYENS